MEQVRHAAVHGDRRGLGGRGDALEDRTEHGDDQQHRAGCQQQGDGELLAELRRWVEELGGEGHQVVSPTPPDQQGEDDEPFTFLERNLHRLPLAIRIDVRHGLKLTAFLAGLSHELKTPLTNMRGFAEPLADGELPAEQSTEFAGRILANVERMQSLIDDLLDLSRIESGVWTPEPDDISLGGLVDSAWNSLLPRQEDRNIELERDYPPDLQLRVDRDALVQVLCNLLDNAVRYTPEGGSVRLTTSRSEDRTRIEVSDDGPGIPTAQLERVFERFYRVDTARSRQAGGTGLGLSIVKHLVAAHGGEVGIESELGAGTTVWFTIPDPASGDPLHDAE